MSNQVTYFATSACASTDEDVFYFIPGATAWIHAIRLHNNAYEAYTRLLHSQGSHFDSSKTLAASKP